MFLFNRSGTQTALWMWALRKVNKKITKINIYFFIGFTQLKWKHLPMRILYNVTR